MAQPNTLSIERSKRLTSRYNQLIASAHSNLVPVDPETPRLFHARAEGSRIWDVDGNEYIDYLGSFGPNILGHCHPEYIQSLKDYIDSQALCVGAGAFCSPDDIVVAEKLIQHIPCAERVKFQVTGTEAVQVALRLARAYTRRPYFLRFGGHYHGWLDNIIGGEPAPDPEGKPFPQYPSDWLSHGYTANAGQEGLMIPWNDIDALEKTLYRYGSEIAIIHFEALGGNNGARHPRPGFLQRVRELCNEYGIVMSIDEIITGFRVGLGGAQDLFGVKPDICTVGKALGGGVPISAVAGKAEILDLLSDSRVIGAGTFSGLPFCIRAVRTTLEILEREDGAAYREMARVQKRLTDGLAEIAHRRGIPMRIQGETGIFYTLFGVDPDREQYTKEDMAGLNSDLAHKFCKHMSEHGVLILSGCRWYPSIVHNDADTDRALEAADRVMVAL